MAARLKPMLASRKVGGLDAHGHYESLLRQVGYDKRR